METVKHELDDASNEARFVTKKELSFDWFSHQKHLNFGFPTKNNLVKLLFRMAEDKAHRTMLDAAKLADELRMEQDNTTRYKNRQTFEFWLIFPPKKNHQFVLG